MYDSINYTKNIMEHDLLQSQIRDSCKLALPEGLKDLMTDISREVLRAQPQNLYQFIADYLSALLVARENLTIASRICSGTICSGACYQELGDELRFLGVGDEEAEMAKKVIAEYFEKGQVNEANLLLKIATITNINENLLEGVKNAVRVAFKRHLVNTSTYYESSSDSDGDEVDRAAKHTLHMYRQTQISSAEYQKATDNVQAAYRAYGVRRFSTSFQQEDSQEFKDHVMCNPERTLRFSAVASTSHSKELINTVSSVTLAGSYMNLPKYVPYSVHNSQVLEDLQEFPEQERLIFTYNDNYIFSLNMDHECFDRQTSAQVMAKVIEDFGSNTDDEASWKRVEENTESFEENN